MKATIPGDAMNVTAYERNHKSDFCRGYVVVSGNRAVIKVRIAQPATRVYCTVDGSGICGGGYADGYGYHKNSAALESAMSSCGIELSAPIGGRGDGAMIEALSAVAVALGYENPSVIEI